MPSTADRSWSSNLLRPSAGSQRTVRVANRGRGGGRPAETLPSGIISGIGCWSGPWRAGEVVSPGEELRKTAFDVVECFGRELAINPAKIFPRYLAVCRTAAQMQRPVMVMRSDKSQTTAMDRAQKNWTTYRASSQDTTPWRPEICRCRGTEITADPAGNSKDLTAADLVASLEVTLLERTLWTSLIAPCHGSVDGVFVPEAHPWAAPAPVPAVE